MYVTFFYFFSNQRILKKIKQERLELVSDLFELSFSNHRMPIIEQTFFGQNTEE
jgi:hypothetical protein